MDPDHVDAGTVKHAVGDVLDAAAALHARDAAADDGDARAAQSDGGLQVRGNLAEPRFARGDGPDVAEGLVLDVHALRVLGWMLMLWWVDGQTSVVGGLWWRCVP